MVSVGLMSYLWIKKEKSENCGIGKLTCLNNKETILESLRGHIYFMINSANNVFPLQKEKFYMAMWKLDHGFCLFMYNA